MFHRPFRVKTQTAIKGSERKKIRNDIGKLFPGLSPDDLLQIIPAKDDMTVAKIYTHSGESLVLYCVQKNPVFIEAFKELIPTIYTLWKFPELLPVFRTWPPVFSKLKGGADLMLPGVVVEGEVTPYTFGKLQKGDLCCVCLLGNKAPVAVGRAALSGSDMFDSAMRGKGVQVVHIFGDELWAFGDKSQPPMIPDNIVITDSNGDKWLHEDASVENEGADRVLNLSVNNICEINEHLESSETTSIRTVQEEENVLECSESLQSLVLKNDEAQSMTEDIGDTCHTDETVNPVESMDELLDICFKCALKLSVKNSDLPLLTSAFFKNHMVKYCPSGKLLDIKKSSYKKLSKFLQKMQKDGYIKVKELSKGADSVVEIDKTQLRDFVPPFDVDSQVSQPTQSDEEFIPPRLTEMFSITTAVLPVFKDNGKSKGSAVTMADVRTCVNEYVKNNDLNEINKSSVQLDPVLAEVVLSKGENDVTHLTWEDLYKRILNKMQPVLCIEYQGQPPVYQKGKVEGIKIDVQQRSSNKKVTIVENVETFGIDPKELAHAVQVGMACSSTVSPLPQKNKGVQIVIQGNQINFIADLLLNKYKVPRKYISGLEKAPKRR